MKISTLALFYLLLAASCSRAMDAKLQIAAVTGEPVPMSATDHSFVELSRSREFRNVYTAVAKITCEETLAFAYLGKCGFGKSNRSVFPIDLNERGISWWPRTTEGSNSFYKDEGDRGYISAVWLKGVLYLFIERN